MRITLVGYLHGQGGIQTHTYYLATGLTERGHEVSVVSPPARNGHSEFVSDKCTFNVLTYKGTVNAMASVRHTRCDVAVVCGVGCKAMLSVLAATGAKKVFFEVMSGASLGLRDPRRLVHLGFDAIVGQGSAVSVRFQEAFGWNGPAVVIPALPEPLERTVGLQPRLITAAGDRPLSMAYFGRLAAHKNVALLIDHWDDIAGCDGKLDIWGTGPEKEALAAQIKSAGRSGQIALKGSYPRGSEYIALLRNYDLTLLATIGDEGAPLVLLESMAAGVPFVANGVGGIGDYANPDCAVTSGDIAEFIPLAQGLVARLRAGKVNIDRLQAHYRNTFGYENLTERWDVFLKQLVYGRRCNTSKTPGN